MPSEHLKFVIPGAIFAAIGGMMLFYGLIFLMIFRLGSSGGSYIGPSLSGTIVIIGAILLVVGIVLLAKGYSVYKVARAAYYKSRARPVQPIAYAPAPAPSYAPNYAPSYAPPQTPSPVTFAPVPIQDPTPPQESLTQEKKYCPSCGAELPKNNQAHFCPSCGGSL